jgi:YedE family putative selenium metabolism protein
MKNLRIFMIVAGFVVGVLAALMSIFGNPANMGVCVACFYRDITGALGFHRAEIVQYLRPEIMGIAIGAFIASSTTLKITRPLLRSVSTFCLTCEPDKCDLILFIRAIYYLQFKLLHS